MAIDLYFLNLFKSLILKLNLYFLLKMFNVFLLSSISNNVFFSILLKLLENFLSKVLSMYSF